MARSRISIIICVLDLLIETEAAAKARWSGARYVPLTANDDAVAFLRAVSCRVSAGFAGLAPSMLLDHFRPRCDRHQPCERSQRYRAWREAVRQLGT